MLKRCTSAALWAALTLTPAIAWAFSDRAQTASPPASAAVPKAAPAALAAPPRAKPVDINRASRAQLKSLPGIGDVEAERIIKARPYPSKAKLLADKVLTPEQYAALKERIVAVPK